MPFPRPTLTVLRSQAMQDITSSDIPGANGFLRMSVLRVLAWVEAGMAFLHYGFMDWICKQAIPYTCTDEFIDGWAGLKGVTRLPPTPASSVWAGTGVNGSPLPAGTVINRQDGFNYVTTAAGEVASGAISVPFVAQTPGSAGNADFGTPLTLATVIEGINSNGVAAAVVSGGTDMETDAAFRTRMLQVYANPPQGGAASDYVTWALQVPGVTRAWCQKLPAGPGTVGVYTMWDIVNAAEGGFPQGTNGTATEETRDTHATGDQLTVANHIYPLRPVTALLYSYAPLAEPLNFTVAGLLPSTPTAQTAVIEALTELLYVKASPLADTPIDQSDVDAAISARPEVDSFRVTAPVFPVTSTLGSIFTLGTVTFA
jgi:uncharacterized phage protein gp47/JayE